MSDYLYIVSLRVRRLPGFPSGGPVLDDVAPGINLVAGPNASGKSSTARALQHMLWPGEGHPDVSIAGACGLGDAHWLTDIDGRRVQWMRDGKASSPPALPPRETRERYLLSLHDLIRNDDRSLAERIQIESAGGFDIDAAAADLEFGSSGRPSKLVNLHKAAREDLRHALEAADDLRNAYRRLETDRRKFEDLEAEAATVPVLEAAVRLAECQDSHAEAQAAVEAFPNVLSRMDGKEVDTVESLRDRIEEVRESMATGRSAAETASIRMRETGLGEEGVSKKTIHALLIQLDALREAESKVQSLIDELAAIVDEESDDVTGLDDEQLKRLLDDLDRFLRRAEDVRQERARLDANLREVEAAERAETPDVEGLRRTLDLLRTWLRTGEGGAGAARIGGACLTVLATILMALLLTGTTASTPLWIVSWIALIAGIGVFVALRWSTGSVRRNLQSEAIERGFAPDSWRADAVRARVSELEKALADVSEVIIRRNRRPSIEAEQEALAEASRTLEAEREAINALLPFAADSDLSLHAAGTRWVDAVQRRRRRKELENRLSHAVQTSGERLGVLQSELAEWAYDVTSVGACEAAIHDLDTRRETHSEAERDRDEALRRVTDLEQQLNRLISDLDSVFDALELSGDSREYELLRLSRHIDAYVEATSHLEVTRRELERASRALEAFPTDAERAAFDVASDAPLDVETLNVELEHARQTALDSKELLSKIIATEQRLQSAREGHDVERALARESEAQLHLAERRELDVENAVGAAMAEWLGRHESTHIRPAVFNRADSVLSEITRGRYQLRLAGTDRAEFAAYDTQDEQLRALDELSAGTRIQLLLAVRVAFIETQESGVAPPLLMDELLANSDDLRAQAIIDASVALAESGRQIFYFTAQADELARWRNRLQTSGILWKEHVLAATNRGFDWTGADVQTPSIPTPNGMTRDDYGRALGVQAFDPWNDGTGSLHLWHVLTDVDALHALVSDGIHTWGQLDNYAHRAGTEARDEITTARDIAEPRVRIVERFAALYRTGRSRAVDRRILVASGAVTETFLDAVSDLAEALAGDGSALVEALRSGEVPRFRSDKCTELEAFLRDEGFIDDTPEIDPEQLVLAVMAESERLGIDLSREECEAFLKRLANGPAGDEA